MKRFFLFLHILFLTTVSISANGYLSNYFFLKIDGKDGLSQNSVKSIIQDSYGFMWFGTRNKLNRYDGSSIKVYDCYDPTKKLRNNNISSLFENKDKKLWVGTDKGVYIYDPIFETFSFFCDSTDTNVKIEDWVADMQMDNNNNIWLVVPNQGLFKFDTNLNKLFFYEIGSSFSHESGSPISICIEQSGRVWIGTNGDGLYLYDKSSDSFSQYLGDKSENSLVGLNIYTMCDIGEDLILGIHEGKLTKFNKRKNTITVINAPEIHHKIIRHITYMDGEVWVATEEGVFIINKINDSIVHIHEDPMYPYALSDNQIEKIYKDKEDGIWITTKTGGVNYLKNKGIKFQRHIPLSWRNSINSKQIREIREEKNGNIWIATEDAGINIYNPKTGNFSVLGKDKGKPLSYNKTFGLMLDEQQVWVGLFKQGLDIIELPSLSVHHYTGEEIGLNEASIYAICEDRNGTIWIGNAWGVYTGNRSQMKFTRQEQFGSNFIYDIIEDTEGNVWVATMGNGVYRFDPKSNKTEHYINNINDRESLSSNSVSSISQTSNGAIWFSTDRGGICRYNKDNNSFTSFSVEDGLPDDVSYKILEDKNNNLWFGTNMGLVRFNPESKKIKVYTTDDGLPGNEFNYKSALASNSGDFYFGGFSGMIQFNPTDIDENVFVPPIYITKLTIFNKEVRIDSDNSPLSKSIIHTDKIVLNHNQSNISFDFVALSYAASSANKYAYMMENVDKDWIYTADNKNISYTKLTPGIYVFKVKGSNNDGLWNETGKSITIEVLPPWWQSNLAYILYILLGVTVISLILFWYSRKTEKKNAEKQWIYETEKEKELYSSKLDFYTNIAHEIRTPITLINGPLELMQEMDIEDPELKKNIQIMSKNTSELLNLVNQLLDFRKVDSNRFLLNFHMVNIGHLVKDAHTRFQVLANKESKEMSITLSKKEMLVPVDRNSLVKILNNLYSNAIRYSEHRIEVQVDTDDRYCIITIANDGLIIPIKAREKIFDPFYQANHNSSESSSSGIGLSLAHSLTELHNGTLEYREYNGLNSFRLKLPLSQEKVAEKAPDNDYIVEENYSKQDKPNAEIILVVEDKVEMLNFIADRLKDQFIVERATNGVKALEILEEKHIDLVLTDIMMPEMDGFELCERIKNDLEYSHIPVVLLTAKNDLDSKIRGLEKGADAYIEKPFFFNHLITQLTTLLENRKREREAFVRKPFLPIQQMGMNKADEEFMSKVINLIEENLTDGSFNVERLAEAFHMSRSTFHRKIRALFDTSPADFIRLVRLRKATEYIANGQYKIGEIGYLVGINSASYFIKLFQKQFGMTPKEFEQKHFNNSNNTND